MKLDKPTAMLKCKILYKIMGMLSTNFSFIPAIESIWNVNEYTVYSFHYFISLFFVYY